MNTFPAASIRPKNDSFRAPRGLSRRERTSRPCTATIAPLRVVKTVGADLGAGFRSAGRQRDDGLAHRSESPALDGVRYPLHGRRVATVILGDFEWNDRKAVANLRKHGVTFEEAVTALADPRALTAPDLYEPNREVTIGVSAVARVLFVVHTDRVRGERVRIISARKASNAQRRRYEEG